MDFVKTLPMEKSVQFNTIRFQLIKVLCLLLFLSPIQLTYAQTTVYSSDSLIKVNSILSDDILLHESIADTLIIEANQESPLILTSWSANEFLSKYKQSNNALEKLRYESEAYCDVVPNCDKILRLPFIKAIHQLDASRYALIGYVRAKSPVFIIRHIWILDVSEKPQITKKILFLGNKSSISFAYNLSKNELTLYQQMPTDNGITENGVFIMDQNGILSKNGISTEPFDESRLSNFLKVAQEHPQVGLGLVMYEIPSGQKIERFSSPINKDKPIYRIQLD